MPSWCSYLLAVPGPISLYLISRGRRRARTGWAIGAATQVLWLIYDTRTRQYGFYLFTASYLWVAAAGWKRTKEDR